MFSMPTIYSVLWFRLVDLDHVLILMIKK